MSHGPKQVYYDRYGYRNRSDRRELAMSQYFAHQLCFVVRSCEVHDNGRPCKRMGTLLSFRGEAGGGCSYQLIPDLPDHTPAFVHCFRVLGSKCSLPSTGIGRSHEEASPQNSRHCSGKSDHTKWRHTYTLHLPVCLSDSNRKGGGWKQPAIGLCLFRANAWPTFFAENSAGVVPLA